MALLKKTQRSFAGGMLDKDLTGRQDLAKYSQGCLELTNFKVRKQGNVVKRPGTDLVCDFTGIKGGEAVGEARLVPLVQERESGYYILITGSRAYLVSPEGVKMNDGTWSRVPAHAASPSTLAPYSISVPFADSDLRMLDWHQSGDTLFFAHRAYPPCKIVFSDGAIAYEEIKFGPASDYSPEIQTVSTSGFPEGESSKYEEYCVTAVKDGVESLPSKPVGVLHSLPWSTEASIAITIKDDAESALWDRFYIYKKSGSTFGLIGATSALAENVSQPELSFVGDTQLPSDITFSQEAFQRSRNDTSLSAVVVENNGTGSTPATAGRSYNTVKTIGASDPSENDDSPATVNFDSVVVRQGLAVCTVDRVTDGTAVYWKAHEMTFFPSLAQKISLRLFNGDVQLCSADIDLGTRQTAATSASSSGETLPFNEQTESQTEQWRRNHPQFLNVKSSVSAEDCARLMTEALESSRPNVKKAKNAVIKIPASVYGQEFTKITLTGYRPIASGSGEVTQLASAQILVSGMEFASFGNNRLSFVDDYITPDTSMSPPKSEEHFSEAGKYPACVALYQQRLVYASTGDDPFTFWMSRTGDLYNFDVHDYVRADDAIKATTAALEKPRINRMLVHRDLMLFSDGGEWQVAPSAGNAVAPSTVSAKLQSVIGIAPWLKPIPIGEDIVFSDTPGEALMATRYNFASDGYESSNLSVLSQRLFRNNPIKAMAYAQYPESTIECVLDDGTVASLVYMKEHDVCAWSLQRLGGGWRAKDVAANKSIVAGSSHCAFIATQEASGAARWAVLGMRDIDPNDATLAGNLRMDAVRTVTVSNVASPPAPGQGETVVKVGAASDGDTYALGYTFKSVIKTTSPEFTDQETAQMEVKNATESEVRVIDGSDFTVRQPEVPAAKATQMKVPCPVDTTNSAFTVTPGDADCRLPLVGNNTINGSIVLEHDGYLPIAVLSVSTSYRVEWANHAEGGGRNE